MHDPESLIYECNLPIPFTKGWDKCWQRYPLFQIWHVDPCTDGTDDSCGSFMRARHGNPDTLKRIAKRFEEDWDRVFTYKRDDHDDEDGPYVEKKYNLGYFLPNGDLNMSVLGIAINLYSAALIEVFAKKEKHSNRFSYNNCWKKAKKYMRKHLAEILFFAENPVDSLRDTIVQTYGKRPREERIHQLAAIIYGDILRKTRPWYKSRNLHIHHWRIKIPMIYHLKRWLFMKCYNCNKSLGFNKSTCYDYKGYLCWRCSAASAPK